MYNVREQKTASTLKDKIKIVTFLLKKNGPKTSPSGNPSKSPQKSSQYPQQNKKQTKTVRIDR